MISPQMRVTCGLKNQTLPDEDEDSWQLTILYWNIVAKCI